MTAGQGVLWVLALIALGFCLRRGPGVVRRVGAETGQSLIKILPMFAAALPMAAFLAELMPADAAVAWIGPTPASSGWWSPPPPGASCPAGRS